MYHFGKSLESDECDGRMGAAVAGNSELGEAEILASHGLTLSSCVVPSAITVLDRLWVTVAGEIDSALLAGIPLSDLGRPR